MYHAERPLAQEGAPASPTMGIAVIITALVAVLAFGSGWVLSSSRAHLAGYLPAAALGALSADQPPTDVDLSPVWKAWNILDEKFVPAALGTTTAATTSPQDREWGMIEGMVASLGDPYTVFMPPAAAQAFQTDISGTFEGVGMEVDAVNGAIVVVSPLKGSPSEKAGMLAKDIILSIDGATTEGMSVDTAVKLIRGPEGSTVTLSVLHDGASSPVDVSIVRGVISTPTLDTKARDDGIFVISLYTFTETSPDLFRDAMRQFVKSGDTKLILDLRGNPGGYLDAAVDMASYFLPSGTVVVTEDYGDKQPQIPHRSLGYNLFGGKQIKMAILVDKGSASASEILSGALHAYGKAVLVGTNTYGKGSVQELVPITADTSLKVTVARWLLPGGIWIPQHIGMTPDIAATTTAEQYAAGKDPQMDAAVEYLKTAK